jgi:hypothetical protein
MCTNYENGNKYIVFVSTCFFFSPAAACGDLAFSFETDTRIKNLVTDTSSENFLFYYFQELFFFNGNKQKLQGLVSKKVDKLTTLCALSLYFANYLFFLDSKLDL